MNRTHIIQKILDKKSARNYLEIGVNDARNFFRTRVRKKVAVDPKFRIPGKQKIKWLLKNFSNLTARYHETTSDDYFSNREPSDVFDVVFIDGLHTHEQSLKDVTNALDSMNDSGVVVLHDCNPPHEGAAVPAQDFNRVAAAASPDWTGEWCGDVWKTICTLRSQRHDLRVFVLDCDYGIGVVTRGEPDGRLHLDADDISRMTYQDLAGNRQELLGLKNENYLYEFLESL